MRLDAKEIAVRFGRAPLLAGVNFVLDPGEMVGLIGPNGAGKTTLMRILANLRRPDAGAVRYGGRRADEIGARALARRLAFLAQDGETHWAMRVEALVALGRLPHRRPFAGPDAADHEAVERALAATDVVYLRQRTMDQISGGERMRVLLARALAVEAELLLADEPIAALDPAHQLQVMELLRAAVRGGRGIAVVLHDLSLAARFCDRLVLLAQGSVLAEGAPSEVLADRHLARAFGVEMLSGERDGVPFYVPRKVVGRGGPA